MARRLASYRIQLTADFGFREAAGIVDYLAELGISHIYCSPILQAAAGSEHGYDVADPTRISEELGGEEGFRLLSEAAQRRGLALLIDIVPNHMSVADRRNRWWWDVLVAGRSSPFAEFFDIDWDHPLMRGRVMAPILEEPFEEAVELGLLGLAVDSGVVVSYRESRLPLSRESLGEVLAGTRFVELAARIGEAEHAEQRWRLAAELSQRLGEAAALAQMEPLLARWNEDRDSLRLLLNRQHYALAHWKLATVVTNYRSFFDITSLIGVRVEDPRVLTATHALIDSLLDHGTADGVRIDHVDGLRLPRRYLERMRRRHPDRWIVVEKILAEGERLRADWPVQGTTGYDFTRLVGGLFVDPAGWETLRVGWAEVTGHPDDFAVITEHAKREVMQHALGANVDGLMRILASVARERGLDKLAESPDRLRGALTEYLMGLEVYRTYIDPAEAAIDPEDRAHLVHALDRASAAGADPEGVDLLRAVLLEAGSGATERELILRLQQTSTVVAAKGVEDTAFYRFPVLSAACEVGGSPGHPAVTVDEFHAANRERQLHWPHTLLATSTHDTKRGEDVRARLYLLSELPEAWMELTRQWRERGLGLHSSEVPGRTMQELLYQTVVGAWPIDSERLTEYMLKAASEAKQRTSWVDPDDDYRNALAAVVQALLDDSAFTADVRRFVTRLGPAATSNALAMTLLRLTAPGVPDTYQGTELCQLTLVDPDNRRPVDYAEPRRLLQSLAQTPGGAGPVDEQLSAPKLHTLRNALGLRRRRPELFDERGDYLPLEVAGSRGDHAVAFARGREPGVVTVVPRLVLGLGGEWDDTEVRLPEGPWRNLFDGAVHRGSVGLSRLLSVFPVALLERT